MRSLLVFCVLVAAPVAFAQPARTPRATGADLEASATAAAANAARPGDENMSCEQLQAEVTRIATSGQVRGALGGADNAERAAQMQRAQADAAAIQNADSRGERERLQRQAIENAAGQDVAADESARRGGGGGVGRRLGNAFGGFGRGRGGEAPDAAPDASPDQGGDAQEAALAAQLESIGGITPEVMRADHLMTLAQNRSCAWVKDYR